MRLMQFLSVTLLCLLLTTLPAHAASIKDIPEAVEFEKLGARFNHGYTNNPVEILEIGPKYTGGDDAFTAIAGLPVHFVRIYNATLTAKSLSAMQGLAELHVLMIDGVHLGPRDTRQLQALKKLSFLSIAGSDTATLDLHDLPNLKALTLERLPNLQAVTLRDLENLQSLRIAPEQKADAGRPIKPVNVDIGDLPALEKIELIFVGAQVIPLNGYRTLKSVTLDCNHVPAGTLDAFAHMPQLEEVNLGGANFDDTQLAALGTIKSLKRICLDSPLMTDRGVSELKDLTNLTIVMLNGRKITDTCAVTFKGMPHMTYLVINGKKIVDTLEK